MFIIFFQRIRCSSYYYFIRSLLTCLCLLLFSDVYGNTVLVLGDSLSAAFLIPPDSGWVTLLEKKVKSEFPSLSVVNASISGDTTLQGLHKLPTLLKKYTPTLVIIQLGGNDGLRGLPVEQIEKNLTQIIKLVLEKKAKILLIGIHLPPNYGTAYTEAFYNIYVRLSKQYSIPLVPFLLQNVALNKSLMFEDGIHPRAEAQPIILENVWPYLRPLLEGVV